MGRYTFSISPCMQLHPWFHGVKADRPFIRVVSRLMSNHTWVKSRLNRIKIVAEAVCGCREDYETVDHILWSCFPYETERMQLKSKLSGEDLSLCARDMLAHRQWNIIRAYLSYLVSIGFHVLFTHNGCLCLFYFDEMDFER
jgi:hypothetical protein